MRMDESLPLMTPQEVADLLKISVRSVYRIRADLGKRITTTERYVQSLGEGQRRSRGPVKN